MVTVQSYAIRERKDGSTFITLQLTGGLEMLRSNATGSMYATVRSCYVPSTLDLATAKSLIGTQLPGQIQKQECDPYEWVNKQSGEVMMLNYTYAYFPSEDAIPTGHTRVAELEEA